MQTINRTNSVVAGATGTRTVPDDASLFVKGTRRMHPHRAQVSSLHDLAIPPLYAGLVPRMGEPVVRIRLMIESERTDWLTARARMPLLTTSRWRHLTLNYGLRAVGLYGRGYRNYLDLRVVHHPVPLPHLPSGFDGFRILHLSDLHIDLDPGLAPRIIDALATLDYDAVVMTGDYRASVYGTSDDTVGGMQPLIHAAKAPVYGVLGNHDFLETVPRLEADGMRFLMNETVSLHRGGEHIYLSGVDDAHTYATHDVAKAADGRRDGAVSLLLSHTPDLYIAAAAYGYDVLLSGHTHAGQICLPGGRILQRNSDAPDYMHSGAWSYHGLRGYTTAGTGATGVPVRFNCPPEIVIHTLQRSEAAPGT